MQNEREHKRGRCAEFVEKVALEALSETKPHAQIASDYVIRPDLVEQSVQSREIMSSASVIMAMLPCQTAATPTKVGYST